MNKVIIDPTLRAKLHGFANQVELCDESGQTVGHFVPDSVYREFLRVWADARLSDDELERRRKEPRGRTLAEIWRSIGRS